MALWWELLPFALQHLIMKTELLLFSLFHHVENCVDKFHTREWQLFGWDVSSNLKFQGALSSLYSCKCSLSAAIVVLWYYLFVPLLGSCFSSFCRIPFPPKEIPP